jgi:hypothetical protein
MVELAALEFAQPLLVKEFFMLAAVAVRLVFLVEPQLV